MRDTNRLRIGLLVVVMVCATTLFGCADLAQQAKLQAEEAAKQEIQRQVDQAKQGAQDAANKAVESAKDAVGISKSIQPDMAHAAYTTSANPLSEFSGHCTWFAWGRAYEKWGVRLPMVGNAGEWYTDKSGDALEHSAVPRADSIAVWQKGEYGHVAYVEQVNGDTIVLNEANWVNPSFEQHGSGYSGSTTSVSSAEMANRYGKFMGYVYIPR